MMICAFNKIRKDYKDFRLEIWGDRKQMGESKLDLLIKELGVSDYVSIHGRTDNVAELYSKAYMFVMSSNYEGLSNALIEALCSGLPVVSTRVSGATDVIVDGENGLLVDVGDEDGFYRAMMRLIEQPEEAATLGKNAKKCRSLFSKELICNQWELLINKSIGNEQKE